NFILSAMSNEGRPFDEVLRRAQELGYAEADPALDIEGKDAAHKLALLAWLAFGTRVPLEEIHTEGITRLEPIDLAFAREFGHRVKLLAIAKVEDGAIQARVHPTMNPASWTLASVDGVFNAVWVKSVALGPLLFSGLGAGMMPTGSAVAADVI